MHWPDGWQPLRAPSLADVSRCTHECAANVFHARLEHLEHLPLDEPAGLGRRARVERRLGVVLGPKLPAPSVVLARQPGEQGEAEVDAGGHPAAGDAVAVFDDPRRHGFRADEGQQIAVGPVSGGPLPLQQAGSAKDQGAGADGGDVRCARAAAGHEVEDVWFPIVAVVPWKPPGTNRISSSSGASAKVAVGRIGMPLSRRRGLGTSRAAA